MDIRYPLSQMFQLAFGVNSPVFLPYPLNIERRNEPQFDNPAAQTPGAASFKDVQVIAQPQSERLSWMGTPIIFPWTLKGGTYKVFDAKGDIADFQIGDFEMPAATLVNFEREKIITRTRLRGNNGTVKEMYGFDDWSCRVRGICLTDSSRQTAKTAQQQKEQLLKWESICDSIPVVGDLFFEKNIMALSIGKITFTQLEGRPDVIPFEFEAFSDERIELIL